VSAEGRAIEDYHRSEERRVRDLLGGALGVACQQAADRAGKLAVSSPWPAEAHPMPPHDVPDLSLTVEWRHSGFALLLLHEGRRVESHWFVHVDTAAETVSLYPILACGRCQRLAPVGPPVEGAPSYGAALEFGEPVAGHHCPREVPR
jgi:hypothetical protein